MASPILLRNSEVFDLDELNHPPRSHRIIGPATTPDIHPHHPHHHLNSAVNINSDGLRFRRASLISALNHVKRSQGAAADQDQDYDESEADYIVNEEMRNWGWLLLVLSSVSFVLGVWSIILGPFIDTTAIPILDVIAHDQHYKYLLIFLVPVGLYFVIINWWGFKIHRQA